MPISLDANSASGVFDKNWIQCRYRVSSLILPPGATCRIIRPYCLGSRRCVEVSSIILPKRPRFLARHNQFCGRFASLCLLDLICLRSGHENKAHSVEDPRSFDWSWL